MPERETLEQELEEARNECADVTEKNQQLEAAVADLIKEVKYLKRVVVELHAGSSAAK